VSSINEIRSRCIHIDGKTAKGSYDREENSACIASSWSSEHGLVLAQHKVEDKSNEITAVPLLLLLNPKGRPWMPWHPNSTASQQAGGEYVLLPGIRKIYHQVETWFEQVANDWAGIEYSYQKTWRRDTIDLKTRQVFAVPVSHYHRCIAKVSGGINHRGHGQAAATVME